MNKTIDLEPRSDHSNSQKDEKDYKMGHLRGLRFELALNNEEHTSKSTR